MFEPEGKKRVLLNKKMHRLLSASVPYVAAQGYSERHGHGRGPNIR
jgi:hypothetical protein